MAEVSNRTKRLVGEITVLLTLTYVWGVRSPTVSTTSVKAGVLKQVVKADPDNVDVYRFLAEFYIKTGRNQEAADALRQVVRIQPYDARAWMILGDIQAECGHNDDALAAYRKAAELRLDNPQAHYQLGQAYLKIGEEDLALEEHKKLKKLDEQLANDLFDRIQGQPQGPRRSTGHLEPSGPE